MNVNNILSFDQTGGLKYDQLSDEQKKHLKDKFFTREPTKNEKADLYRYHFNGDVCTHAT